MKEQCLEKTNFSPQEWVQSKEAGCYPYAMNWLQMNKFILIGDLIGNRMESYHSDEELIQTFTEELESLGYVVRKISVDEETLNGRKIYLMRAYFSGRYHLFREDSEGWSHKYPGALPVNLDFDGELLTNPDEIHKDEFYGWCFEISRKTG